jgi:hypothetical protein
MLAATSYPKDYVVNCRAQVDAQLAAFAALPAGPERDAFEPLFLDGIVIMLDHLFVHRQRGREEKKGSLKDVRALAVSIGSGEDAVSLDAERVRALADACFAEIERRFT